MFWLFLENKKECEEYDFTTTVETEDDEQPGDIKRLRKKKIYILTMLLVSYKEYMI